MGLGVALAVIAGGALAADSAANAADSQAAGTAASIREQRNQYQQTREDQAPWRQAGVASLGRLQQLLGIGGGGGGGQGAPNALQQAASAGRLVDGTYGVPRPNMDLYNTSPQYRDAWDYWLQDHNNALGIGYTSETGANELNARLRDRLQEKGALEVAMQPSQGGGQGDQGGEFGSLMRTFSMQDLQNDPVYQASFQFGLDEGRKGLERRQAATGSFDSGAALKDLTRFGSDYTGQRAGQAYDRFNQNQTNQYNRLASLSGIGQTASNTTAQAGANSANNISNLYSGLGNAQGAAQIAQGNAWNQGLSTLGNYWQQSNMLNQMNQQRNQAQPAYSGAYTPPANNDGGYWY